MINDLWTSLKATLYDRTASPLFGAFAVSWLLWNYRLVAVLLSTEPVSEKFVLIDSVLYPDRTTQLLSLLTYPLTTALVFLFVYPLPARWVFHFWRTQQQKLKKIRQKIEDETPLTIEESRRLRNQIIDLRGEYERQLRQTSEESDQLRAALRKEQEQAEQVARQLEEMRTAKSQGDVEGEEATPPGGEADEEFDLDQPVTEESLTEYAAWKFPSFPPSAKVNKRLLADLDLKKYSSLRSVDAAVDAAEHAVNAYASENPDFFKSGTDRITKSLGFTDASFRKRHGFADITRAAFEQHRDKVSDVEDRGSLTANATPHEIEAKDPRLVRGAILWVDDKEANVAYEIAKLREHGFRVDHAGSTSEAMSMLTKEDFSYDLVISDLIRQEDGTRKTQAGIALLDQLRDAGLDVPFIIYSTARDAERHRDTVIDRGGHGVTRSALELFDIVTRDILPKVPAGE